MKENGISDTADKGVAGDVSDSAEEAEDRDLSKAEQKKRKQVPLHDEPIGGG
jgi:hypothetical protein